MRTSEGDAHMRVQSSHYSSVSERKNSSSSSLTWPASMARRRRWRRTIHQTPSAANRKPCTPAAVDTPLAIATLQAVAGKSPSAKHCLYSAKVPHSVFSPKDRPGELKPWLEPFEADVVSFARDGRGFEGGSCPGNP